MSDKALTTQLAKAIRAAWVDRLDWDELAEAALEFLTAAGRLTPTDGKTLTAEEWADFLNVIHEGRGDYSSRDRLREKFPKTGPWQTWDAAPDGVKYRGIGANGGVVYVNYGGQRFRAESGALSLNTDRSVQMTAPFVAAEEG